MKLIAREPTPEMLKAGVDWTRGAMNPISTQTARGIFAIMWDAAPSAPVEVTDEVAAEIGRSIWKAPIRGSHAQEGRDAIEAVQQVLGQHLGMVTREEMARQVEAAFREGHSKPSALSAHCTDDYWINSAARKRLGGG